MHDSDEIRFTTKIYTSSLGKAVYLYLTVAYMFLVFNAVIYYRNDK